MKTLKNILFAAISIACILLGIYSFRLKNDLDKINRKDLTTKKAIEAEAEIISRKIDKEGLQHATIAAAGTIVSQSDIKGPAVSVGILDTTAMAIGVLKKQIENLMVVNSTLRADNLRAYQALDEKKSPVYKYTDKYLDLSFKPGNPTDTTDKGSFDFKYNADLTIAHYWKRNKFLGLPIGAKNSYIDIYSNDPRTTINGVKNLHMRQEQPFLGLRLQGITNYNFESGTISPGAGLQFDAGRMSIMGSYLYNPKSEKWTPSVTGRYDIIRF